MARYNDGGNTYLNFLNLNFSNLVGEKIWLFPPKSHESVFLQYYLSWTRRPYLVMLLLQHQSLPPIYNLALQSCARHQTFTDRNFLSRAVKGSRARTPHPFKGLFHIFEFAQVN